MRRLLLAVTGAVASLTLLAFIWATTTNNDNDNRLANVVAMAAEIIVQVHHAAAVVLSFGPAAFATASAERENNEATLLPSKNYDDLVQDVPRRQLLLQEKTEKNSIRIFGPVVEDDNDTTTLHDNKISTDDGVSFHWFTAQQQRQFLQEYGRECWPAEQQQQDGEDESKNNLLVQRFDAFSLVAPFLQVEIWKFCVFYTQQGNVFWDRSQVTPLVRWQDIWTTDERSSPLSNTKDGDQSTALLVSTNSIDATATVSNTVNRAPWIHSSLLRLDPPYAASFSRTILRLLLETDVQLLTSSPLYAYKAMAQQIQNDNAAAKLLKAYCQVPSPRNPADQVLLLPPKQTKKKSRRRSSRTLQHETKVPPEFSQLPSFGMHCTAPGGYCCQVWNYDNDENTSQDDEEDVSMPILMVKHPFGTTGGVTVHHVQDTTSNQKSVPALTVRQQQYPASQPNPYWSTVTAVPTGEATETIAASKLETPNFFDILLQNNCLPTSPACHSCLKRYTSTTGCDEQCAQDCPCYCKVLCQIRPPPKHVQAVWYVTPPLYQLPAPLPPRLIPRIVHQTWYEPLTPDKYPNMSRLQQSWKQSGWEHKFYDDATAAKFLEQHFPPQVLKAYHAIQPGAFKADLFRYCCLLIQGGVYADMDVLLETNLEHAIAPNVGFMTPMDEPGIKVGQQACLWNGFMAVAPGHPFVAKTIELVVNNIRNRFTSVDYDDMLCPDPILSAAHLWDILFTTGPCILGTAMNMVLQRHPQTGFTTGEIDIWGDSSVEDKNQPLLKSANKPMPKIEPNDPRLAIPGRSIILLQNKNDMGAHRFTLEERNLVVCSTDMPEYDDRPKKPHYAESGKQTSLYGTTQLYSDFISANEEIRVIVVGNPSNFTL